MSHPRAHSHFLFLLSVLFPPQSLPAAHSRLRGPCGGCPGPQLRGLRVSALPLIADFAPTEDAISHR